MAEPLTISTGGPSALTPLHLSTPLSSKRKVTGEWCPVPGCAWRWLALPLFAAFKKVHASNNQRPPTMVRSIGMVIKVDGFSRSGSRPRTTRSANFPASIDPLMFSS